LVGLVTAAAYVGWPWLLYPLALLSALGVVSLLTSVCTMLVVITAGKENSAETWRRVAIFLMAGLTVSIAMISAIDVLRYLFTRTLSGIPLP
jgi:hypothetical protein